MPNLRFFVHPGKAGTGLSFDLLLDEDQALSGGDFADRETCLAAIRATVEALGTEKPFILQSVPGGQTLALNSPAGSALATSPPLDPQAATALRDALTEIASGQEEYGIEFPPTMVSGQRTAPAFLSAAHAVSAADYDFAWLSASGLAGFESFQNTRDGRHFFHFNDAQGSALLYSRGFGTASERNKRMRAVMDGGPLAQRYERREEDGSSFFILKARNGQEIARSRAFTVPGERDAAVAWLIEAMPEHAEQSGPLRAGRPRRKSPADLALASLTGAAGFELLRNPTDRRHSFLFNGDDGRPLLFGQGYKTKEGRDQAVQTLIRLGANPSRYEAVRAEGEHAFVIRAGNRQEVARSRPFESEAAAAAAIGLLQERLPDLAPAFGVPAETLEARNGERLTIRADRERSPLATAVGVGALAALGESARAEAASAPMSPIPPVGPLPPVTPIAPTTAGRMPPTNQAVAPPSNGSGKAAHRTNAAGWGRLWPVPLAAVALVGVPWLLLAHPQPHPVPAQNTGPNTAVRQASPVPVRTAVDSYIASARPGHSQMQPAPDKTPAHLLPVGRARRHNGTGTTGAAGDERLPLGPALSEGSEISPRPRPARRQPDPSVLYGQGS